MILGVNVDHVATLREARRGVEPDPLMAATLAILGGADGITVHLREDRRHVNERDVRLLREMVTVELNLEMAATDEMTRIAMDVRPDMATLVPEKRQELTTEGGMDLLSRKGEIMEAIKKLRGAGIPVSLFINPSLIDVDISMQIQADMVEIHTGYYANMKGRGREEELHKVQNSAKVARQIGLMVNAGHGLNYHNVSEIACIEGIRGLYIGHSIVSRAVLVGMERAVREMKELVRSAAA
jgi:pyridoxine 5-phosphate synthase